MQSFARNIRVYLETNLALVAVIVWAVVALVIAVRAFGWPYRHSLLPIYTTAAQNWLASNDVYAVQPNLHDLYRYSPAVAILFIPLSCLPDNLAGLLWRLLNFAVFFCGIAQWCRAVLPGSESFRRVHWALFALLLLPLSLESLNNGQINPLMLGLLLGATAAARSQRWNLSAGCAALAGLLKIYPLALGLLLVLIYPRKFAPRFLAILGLGLALPFVCQHFDYAAQQYQTWFQLLVTDDRSDWPLRIAPQDLALLLRVLDLSISPPLYNLLRLFLAACLAALCLAARPLGLDDRQRLTLLSTQACCWMILCGPNSEPCTFVLLAPVVSWAVVDGWQGQRSLLARWSATTVLAILLLPFLFRMFSGGESNAAGLMPLGAACLSIHLLITQIAPGLLQATSPAPFGAGVHQAGQINHQARIPVPDEPLLRQPIADREPAPASAP